jgi:hypothetical protein
MTALWGILVAAALFGIFTALRSRDRGCNGNCVGCTRDAACKVEGMKP